MTASTSYQDAATTTVDVGRTRFAYRDLGRRTGTPVIFLNHLAAVLDNWDPRVVDGIASSAQARASGAATRSLAEAAWGFALRA